MRPPPTPSPPLTRAQAWASSRKSARAQTGSRQGGEDRDAAHGRPVSKSAPLRERRRRGLDRLPLAALHPEEADQPHAQQAGGDGNEAGDLAGEHLGLARATSSEPSHMVAVPDRENRPKNAAIRSGGARTRRSWFTRVGYIERSLLPYRLYQKGADAECQCNRNNNRNKPVTGRILPGGFTFLAQLMSLLSIAGTGRIFNYNNIDIL